MKKFKNKISIFDSIKLRKIVNKLEIENESLKNIIKDELYKIFMEKLNEPTEMARYKKENKNLRAKIKTLKALLRGDSDGK